MKRSHAILICLAATIALTVSACGARSGTNDVVADGSLAKAVTATTGAHGSRVNIAIALSSDALPQTVKVSASGVMDQVRRQAHIDLDLSAIADAAGIDASAFKATEILHGTVFYLRFPFLDGKLPGGKKWIKVDLAKAGDVGGLHLGQALQSGQDPSQEVGYLRTVTGAKKVGTETIDGVQTTHYHGVARVDRYPELLPKRQRAAARVAIQKLIKASGSDSFPMDAWVGRDHLIRRVHFVMTMKVPQSGQPLKVDVLENLSDFGTAVHATPPPSREVLDLTKATADSLKSELGG